MSKLDAPLVTDFPKPPVFTPEQREALLKGESVGVNGVLFSLANLGRETKVYGPPTVGATAFAAYRADPAAWKAVAAGVAKKMGKKPGELEDELGYPLLDELISIVNHHNGESQ